MSRTSLRAVFLMRQIIRQVYRQLLSYAIVKIDHEEGSNDAYMAIIS